MNEQNIKPITELLAACSRGEVAARDLLFEAVYDELRKIARAQLPHSAGKTLQPTALVHEAYLRLYKGSAGGGPFHSRKHFFAAAAKAMRHFLVDDVRQKGRVKRGGSGVGDDGRILPQPDAQAGGSIEDSGRSVSDVTGAGKGLVRARTLRENEPVVFDQDHCDALAIDEALRKLEKVAPRQAKVVELRYFGSFTVDETAEALEISPRCVDVDWRLARVWLHRELSSDEP